MLHVHRSERADALVAPLAEVLGRPPADVFAVDVVAVPTRGVERWLAQRLSHHLGTGPDGESGIAANIRFDSPGRLLDDVAHAALGTGLDADDDPWSRDRLAWHVLDVVDACATEPWCSALGRYLGATLEDDEVRRGRRMQVATHLATLFTSYATQRPDMVAVWANGRDDDGTGRPLPADLRWQMLLWQRVREHVGTPGPAERLADVVDRLRADPGVVDLPDRLSVFGATRLAAGRLRVLAALAERRDVHLWVPHPSPALWAATPMPSGSAGALVAPRRADIHVPAAHPLLASMARDVTELRVRLAAVGADDVHHPAPAPPATLLGVLQDRLRADRADRADATGEVSGSGQAGGADDAAGTAHVLDPADRSVRVHACHGRARQIEVLREALMGLFADDPTLEPRDVVVMCPDVEAFAPLVAATFGTVGTVEDDPGHGHPGRQLRVRVADRSLRQTNPLLAMLAGLLELADGRVTASDVVDLASSEPVRQRFGLDDEAVDRIRAWAVAAGARWGEDRSRRERFGLGHVAQGTWETALDRILLGVSMAEEDQRWVGSALPLDDVASTDIELAGHLAELVDRLTVILRALDGNHPAEHWFEVLDHALDLLGGTTARDRWQDVEARQVLDEARRAAGTGGRGDGRDGARAGALLGLADVRTLLADRLAGRPTRAGFRTGALTVCSMEPMRAVPHRVVVLLGLDDGAFPRGVRTDGDDLLLRDPLVGERDRRSEDRQVFLDAVTAATEHLVVLHSGADERTGAPRPPAVPVSELLDALDATATTSDGAPVRQHVVVRHPLQTVDERNFADGALGRPGPFAFDAVSHRAALVAREVRRPHPPFLDGPLGPPEDDEAGVVVTVGAGVPTAPPGRPGTGTIDLDDLVRVLENPVRAFVRMRLGVSLPGESADLDDALPLTLDPLEQWQIGDRLLRAALEGIDLERAIQAEARRGEVPPRRLGGTVLDDLRDRVRPVADAALEQVRGAAETVDVTVDAGGRLVTGTVLDVHDGVLVRAVYSKLAAKHRLRAWVQLLALVAQDPTGAYRAVTVGRSPSRSARASLARLEAPHPDDAVRWLGQLVALRDAALREPLPLPIAASCAYGRSRAAGDTVEQALESAGRELTGAYEHLDDHLRLAWGADGGPVTFDAVLAPEPSSAERVWWPEEPTRFGVLARRLWEPLLEHERTETL